MIIERELLQRWQRIIGVSIATKMASINEGRVFDIALTADNGFCDMQL